ncbi:MAG: DUF4388 domain-containing protein [Acidobacteriota bacterium]|nr:DUF4388 domain-containing protein [Acidobacteriota bacterium]
MALTGHLSDLSLSELIEFFCNQRKTGQLKVLYPEGHGYFYLQTGSVVDARIGVLRGIDAVYYALTLPNAKFEFGSSSEPIERTINQPWTQVVLEGLRRLDEGVVPAPAFPADYTEEQDAQDASEQNTSFTELDQLRVPSFLSFISKESMGKRRYMIASVVTVVVLMTVAAIGVPAGWYGRTDLTAVSQPLTAATTTKPASSTVPEVATEEVAQPAENNELADAAKRQRDKEKAKAREEARQDKAALLNSPAPTSPAASTNVVPETAKASPKKITVTVVYDESGRVTQASGGDAGAVRIARQKRFPAGKAGSATVTIPVN